MKVLHVETGRNLYGGPLQVFYLLRGLHERAVENVLVCDKRGRIRESAEGLARIFPVTVFGDLDASLALKLRRILAAEKPDIVHIHSRRGADVHGLLSARLSGLKVVITRRVDNPEPSFLARLKYGACDRVVAISDTIKNVLLEYGIPVAKVTRVHSAVDTALFHPANRSNYLKKEFGLSGEAIVVGVSAQLIKRKGHEFFLEALPGLLRDFPELKAVFFGKGALEEKLGALVRKKGLEDAVSFAGFRDDMPLLMPCLDILAHPALMEGLGVSLLQAAASGVPIVASEAGGIPEIVRHGENGLLARPGDSGDLAMKLRILLCDPELRRKMGMAGRGLAEREFSIEKMVEGNLQVYKELLGTV